jgi:sugar transferase (PEP-CTERM/EpsH1 system associated)
MGGTEFGIIKVIEGLEEERFEHRICTLRGYDEDFAWVHGVKERVCVAGRAATGFQFFLGRLARIMLEFRPHIVHSRNWGAIEAIPAARLARVPLAIHSEHGYEVEMLTGLPRRRKIARRIAYAAADAVFAVTQELRDFHARQAWISADRIGVLPNGVDTSRFRRNSQEREEVRRSLGLNEHCIVIGSVGRLVPIKDHPTFLKAAGNLVKRGISVHILLAGSGPELSNDQQLVNSSADLSGRVTFVGSSIDVPVLLNALDVFVLASLREGMSNTILEAMASSLPVVATNVGGNPELIVDGCCGLLFAPGDVSNLSERLQQLSVDSNLRQRLGRAARNRVVEQFSLEAMINNYRNLYVSLARKRGICVADLG